MKMNRRNFLLSIPALLLARDTPGTTQDAESGTNEKPTKLTKDNIVEFIHQLGPVLREKEQGIPLSGRKTYIRIEPYGLVMVEL